MDCSKSCFLIFSALLLSTAGFVLTITAWFAPPLSTFVDRVRVAGPVILLIGFFLMLLSCVLCSFVQGRCCSCCYTCSSRKQLLFKEDGDEEDEEEVENYSYNPVVHQPTPGTTPPQFPRPPTAHTSPVLKPGSHPAQTGVGHIRQLSNVKPMTTQHALINAYRDSRRQSQGNGRLPYQTKGSSTQSTPIMNRQGTKSTSPLVDEKSPQRDLQMSQKSTSTTPFISPYPSIYPSPPSRSPSAQRLPPMYSGYPSTALTSAHQMMNREGREVTDEGGRDGGAGGREGGGLSPPHAKSPQQQQVSTVTGQDRERVVEKERLKTYSTATNVGEHETAMEEDTEITHHCKHQHDNSERNFDKDDHQQQHHHHQHQHQPLPHNPHPDSASSPSRLRATDDGDSDCHDAHVAASSPHKRYNKTDNETGQHGPKACQCGQTSCNTNPQKHCNSGCKSCSDNQRQITDNRKSCCAHTCNCSESCRQNSCTMTNNSFSTPTPEKSCSIPDKSCSTLDRYCTVKVTKLDKPTMSSPKPDSSCSTPGSSCSKPDSHSSKPGSHDYKLDSSNSKPDSPSCSSKHNDKSSRSRRSKSCSSRDSRASDGTDADVWVPKAPCPVSKCQDWGGRGHQQIHPVPDCAPCKEMTFLGGIGPSSVAKGVQGGKGTPEHRIYNVSV